MGKAELQVRLLAQVQIDDFMNRSRLSEFRGSSNRQTQKNAERLAHFVSVVNESDTVENIKSLNQYADELVGLELYNIHGDGHHKRMASELRRIADAIRADGFPWTEFFEPLEGQTILVRLAKVLWQQNVKQESNWRVRLDVLIKEVWAEELKSVSAIRAAVSRLSTCFTDQEADVHFSVNGSKDGGYVEITNRRALRLKPVVTRR